MKKRSPRLSPDQRIALAQIVELGEVDHFGAGRLGCRLAGLDGLEDKGLVRWERRRGDEVEMELFLVATGAGRELVSRFRKPPSSSRPDTVTRRTRRTRRKKAPAAG